ncbi:LysR family transcriptional regulator [Pandoraea nosoerga]|uniref:LysR family transcriptional regulator n=1 Tax=Pandoraea nosoerga TaxID=2508296 RepID=A0A5E4WTC0_9BURK|nr:LysR family transcriptional regulator [Pandoraea nosoerga]MBN4666359.1 LysR family transcriptional regulator [Pandoraea nosoerga]MBN4675962.1 LysR family transcriptional regulator [Pandoraea nosoerga]MBN4682057.1 LysR family transcriptional regulator [Pandoraea nosoerga]MBN4746447.1 LysR family transcriptional regulator [Pandoraea nosoerga]VVE28078.1 LysR family transcriptional regulator [Pandoraea nosoerga]
MDLHSVDLNLLVVFQHLYNARRVSRVAEALGVTQPAVSNSLARLRKLFNDELFIRTSRGMLPTPLAIELAEPVAAALDALHGVFNRQLAFDPATSQRAFRIAMTDIGEVHFLPKLMHALGARAPGITVSTVRNTAINLHEEMAAGQVDLAVGHLPDLTAAFFQRRLFRQRYVCMFRPGHPLDRPGRRRMTREDFERAEQVMVVAAGTGHGQVDDLMARAHVQRNIRLRVPHFVALADILHATDLIATVTEKFAQRSAQHFGLRYVDHPLELPDVQINLFWHARYHREPASQWMRALLFDLFSE